MESKCLWLTGLSGSGKTTIANSVKKEYPNAVLLDGDIIREGLCKDLGFSDDDRTENMRRIRELCKLLILNGKTVIVSFITPFESDRIKAKEEIPNCSIIWINSTLEECEERDTKGLYKKSRDGEIENFTGIDSPYEIPKCFDLSIDTENFSEKECVDILLNFLNKWCFMI